MNSTKCRGPMAPLESGGVAWEFTKKVLEVKFCPMDIVGTGAAAHRRALQSDTSKAAKRTWLGFIRLGVSKSGMVSGWVNSSQEREIGSIGTLLCPYHTAHISKLQAGTAGRHELRLETLDSGLRHLPLTSNSDLPPDFRH